MKGLKENRYMSRNEFIGAIVDIFEEFLEIKEIEIKNPEKDEAIKDGEDPESIANIYGSDYGMIQDMIEELLG